MAHRGAGGQSKYITLETLAGIVRSGSQVKVVEASTDRDLTRQVLMQVILEQQDALDLVPVELLHAVIRVRGTLEQAPFAAFLAAVTSQFISRGNLLGQQLSSLMGTMPGFGAVDLGAGAGPRTARSPEAEPGEEGKAEPSEAGPEAESRGPSAGAHSGNTPAAPPNAPPSDTSLTDVRQRMNALISKLQR